MLLKEAVGIARGKAKIIAEAGERSLGRMLSARINSYTAIPRMANVAAMKAVALDAAEPPKTVIETKDIDITADIETVFSLE